MAAQLLKAAAIISKFGLNCILRYIKDKYYYYYQCTPIPVAGLDKDTRDDKQGFEPIILIASKL